MGLILAVLLVWNAPETRTDGSRLYPHDIASYEVSKDGNEYTSTTETHAEAASRGVYRCRAIDVDGRVSDWSNAVRVKRKDLR